MCLITFSWYERRTSAGTPSSIRKNAFTACKKVHLCTTCKKCNYWITAWKKKVHSLPAKRCIHCLQKEKHIHCLQKGSSFNACKKEAYSRPAKRKHIHRLQQESAFTACEKKAHSLFGRRKCIHCLSKESAFTAYCKFNIRKILFIVWKKLLSSTAVCRIEARYSLLVQHNKKYSMNAQLDNCIWCQQKGIYVRIQSAHTAKSEIYVNLAMPLYMVRSIQ